MNNWKKKLLVIWAGESFSSISSALVQFAIIWWITKETGSSRILAYTSMAAFLPQALLSPFVGVLVDRWNKKYILILSDVAIALFSAILGLLYFYDRVELWHVYLILALRSVGNTFYIPTLQAAIPMLAPQKEFMRIAAVNQMIQALGNTLGPALGAVSVMMFPMPIVIAFDVLGAFVACVLLAIVKFPRTVRVEQSVRNIVNELKEGVVVLMEHRGLALIVIMSALFYFVFMPLNALYPLMIFEHFNGGALEMGIIEFVFGVCMIVGGGILGIWNIPMRKVTLINISYLGMGAALAFIGLLPSSGYVWFVVLFGLFGLFVPVQSSPLTALIQVHIEPSVLGRVFALMGALNALSALGFLIIGYVAEYIGMPCSFSASGILIFIMGMGCFFIPSIMGIEKK